MTTLRDAAQQALGALETVLSDAYHRRFPECCGRPGIECCGNPNEAWTPEDNKIMDLLSPAQRQLSEALRAALAEAADDARGRELLDAFDDAPQPKADRADVPVWDEVYDCAVAAYCRSSTSKDALRLCFQSRHQQHHIAVGWTANELMDFAKGIAALYTAPQPVKRVELTDDEIGVVWGDTAMADIAVAKNHADGVCEFAQAIIAAYNAKNGITSEANGQIK